MVMLDESFRYPSDGPTGARAASIDAAKVLCGADDEQTLREDFIALALHHGRDGYRRGTASLCHAGWTFNPK